NKPFLTYKFKNKLKSMNFRYMKPLLTHSRPTLLETLPVCCNPIARLLTTTEQLTQDGSLRRTDSDSDICIEGSDVGRSRGGSAGGSISGGTGDLRRNSINRFIYK
ncbi:hypothetical protein DOY81_011494, partial [Sarcophaga bullata]